MPDTARNNALASLRTAVCSRVEGELDRLADAMISGYQKEISSYGFLDDPSALAEVKAGTRMNLAVILRALAVDRELSEQEIAALKEIGTRRAAQGFPLHALLRAYQVGTRLAWERILAAVEAENPEPTLRNEIVARFSISILGITGQISGAVTQAYLETERVTAQTEERIRRDVFNELVWGPLASSVPLRERAARVGYKLGDAHAVAVVALDGVEQGADQFRKSATIAMRAARPAGVEPVVDLRNGLVVAIIPCDPNTSDRDVAEAVAKALSEVAAPPAGRAIGATGRIERGISGVTTSFRQALRAADAAKSLGVHDPVVSYIELTPSMLLLGDPNAAMDLYRSTVEPLVRHDADEGTQLVGTLEALLAERGNMLAAAKRLYVHRHTLAARMERIEELTRRSLRERDDVLLLELGLRAREVLPAEPAADTAARRGLLDNLSTP